MQRDIPLAAQNAIPQKQLDTDLADQEGIKAAVQAAQAAQQNTELNLAWTKIYSPIDGIAGVANSQIGDLVGTSTKMVMISQVNPIWAYFNVSEGTSCQLRLESNRDDLRQGPVVGPRSRSTVECISRRMTNLTRKRAPSST